MKNSAEPAKVPKHTYRPKQRLCPLCGSILKRSHILWRKRLIFTTGSVDVVSWAYRCPAETCTGTKKAHFSAEAESLHLKHRRFSQDLYIMREQQLGLTLLAENLDESSDGTIRARLLQPLKELAQEMGLSWHGIISDAQDSIRAAVAKELPGVPHQACQSHCLINLQCAEI